MITTILVKFVTFSGYYGYILQKGEHAIQIPQKIDNIVFYRYDKKANEAKIILNFLPNTGRAESYEFHLDTPKMEKITTHRNSDGIKPKEDFSYCNQGNALWVNADSVKLAGPHYQKVDYTTQRKNQTPLYGGINYEIKESFTWNGGSYSNRKWSDYLQFLNLKYNIDSKFQELRWTSKDALEIVNEAIQTLEDFKKSSRALMKIWQEGDVDTLVAYCLEYAKENNERR